MRIAGLNDRGEARIIDDHGNLVGYGELRLREAHLAGLERGDRFAVHVVITWTPDLPDDDWMDFDALGWQGALSDS